MKYNFHQKKFCELEINPGKIAIAGSDCDLNWSELQKKTLELAEKFIALQIPQGHPVMIYGHKEAFFPLAMLACIHAGIPYIPMDKIYPIDRLKRIAEITGSQILINCTLEKSNLDAAITIDSNLKVSHHHLPDFDNKCYGDKENKLQYIMFTSGSTGEPKGVQISQNSVLTFLDWALKDFGFSENDVFLNQAPFTFDVSLCDVLNAFALGASLILSSTEIVKEPQQFFARIKKYQCTVWTSTPSFAYLFLRNENFNSGFLSSINCFLFMGEELPKRSVSILKSNFSHARILNAYGPTEATIVTTLVEITNEVLECYSTLPIGYPMPGSTLLIEKINAAEKEGELIIVGEHVSHGYFKNDIQNQEKFFMHQGQRAFKTGDLAYYENDMLFYLGRNDDQIKMNGFRIELNEISNVLCQIPLVTDAVSVALKRNKEVKKIISFVQVSTPVDFDNLLQTSKPFLEKTLPYYMIPGDIVLVDEFPYSTSHKIDKNKLIEMYLKNQREH